MLFFIYLLQQTSSIQSCRLCRPHGVQDCSTPGLCPSPSPGTLELKSVGLVMPSNQLNFYHFLLPPIFPSIRVVLNDSRGYIKGSILSACLFICRVHHVKYKTGYADDAILIKQKKRVKKVGLKLNMQKTKIMVSGPITSWQIDGGNKGNSDRLSFLGRQSHCRWWLQPWN